MTRSMPRPIHAVMPLLILLGACAGDVPSGGDAGAAGAAAATVAWFDGPPDAAFALAKSEGKPLFLYWGAEWCPPCHYLKEKIFTRPGFVERSRDFVAVYLDGDDESAQILGEQLDVQGYPTVIVFGADGRELLRMPSDVQVERYAEIMERAVHLDRPIQEILGAVLAAGPAASPPADLDVLAYYSWGQDSKIALPDAERLATFRRLWDESPAERAGVRARFLALYVGEAARLGRHAEEGAAPALDAAERQRVEAAVLELLADEALCRENVFDVVYGAADAIGALEPEAGPGRAELTATWSATLERLRDDAELTTDDRLSTLLGSYDLARLDGAEDAPLPDALVALARRQVAWAMDAVQDGSELQAVLNTAAYVLDGAGLGEEAQQLLGDKLDQAAAPYYFMSWLAALKADAGDSEAALELYRKAWQSADGRYTRFRWGSSYLRQLMDLAPERADTLESDALTILDELLTHDDAFALGNTLRLNQLQGALEAWNEGGEHAAVVDHIRQRVHAACDGYPGAGEDSQRQRCRDFLAAPEQPA
jgi:thiol-disulfide isomerase/thioredoxin